VTIRIRKGIDTLLDACQEELIQLDELRSRVPELRKRKNTIIEEFNYIESDLAVQGLGSTATDSPNGRGGYVEAYVGICLAFRSVCRENCHGASTCMLPPKLFNQFFSAVRLMSPTYRSRASRSAISNKRRDSQIW
jgi:hypothetical protein